MLQKINRLASRIVSVSGNSRRHLASGGVGGLLRYFAAAFIIISAPLYQRFGAKKYSCPCCDWNGPRFLPYIDKGYVTFETECPVCHSHPRHRGHILFYKTRFSDIRGRLLYFAPEENIRFFRQIQNLEVKSSEFSPQAAADFHFDILNIECNDNSWDYIVCHRVVEHLPDDVKGMNELYRILKPGGTLVLSVPIQKNLIETIEYGKPNPLETDHYYRYGADFPERIPRAFQTEILDFRQLFSKNDFKRFNLIDDTIFLCRKPVNNYA